MRALNFRHFLNAVAFTFLVLMCFAPTVLAQEFNVYVGNTNSIFGPWSLRSSSSWGGSFEYPIWYDVSLEQRVGYLINFPEPSQINTRTGTLLMDTNVNLKLPFHFFGLTPYITVGLGVMHAMREDPNKIGSNIDFNYGAGVKYWIMATPFGVRLDVRGHNFRNVVDQSNINTIEYTAGLIYRMRK